VRVTKIFDFLKRSKPNNVPQDLTNDVPQDLSKDFVYVGGPDDGHSMVPLCKLTRHSWVISDSGTRYYVYETVPGNRLRFIGYAGKVGEMPVVVGS
jgi:hypothetical protein